jgi:hypothetical protein
MVRPVTANTASAAGGAGPAASLPAAGGLGAGPSGGASAGRSRIPTRWPRRPSNGPFPYVTRARAGRAATTGRVVASSTATTCQSPLPTVMSGPTPASSPTRRCTDITVTGSVGT